MIPAERPDTQPLFQEIIQHLLAVKASQSGRSLPLNQVEPLSKKRKLGPSGEDASTWACIQTYADISFSIPQRKKLKLGISGSATQGIKGTNAGGDVEVGVPWKQIRDIFCLPLPEKAQAQYNFCIFSQDPEATSEQVLWTVPDTIPKEGLLDPPSSDETYRSHILATINRVLAKQKRSIVVPTEEEFASQVVQAHRKHEKAYHVKAFRGAKDGFLFFLSNGIFWGFKKPLEFFAFHSIDSVSYTSVLQRTFNLNITARASSTDSPQEFEFSMVDQEDFAGIDAYIKRHQLQDASMAEKRRARRFNINGPPAANDATSDGEANGEGELQKAAREAKDLNDDDDDEEDDENFDPGSEGQSEGEGSSSEEEEEVAAE